MQCPHCLEHFTSRDAARCVGEEKDGYWWVNSNHCANSDCGRLIVQFLHSRCVGSSSRPHDRMVDTRFPVDIDVVTVIYPKTTGRPPVPAEVPNEYSEDYKEACLVLADSPKASAALSRRCLQHILREEAGATARDLNVQIDFVLESGSLPSGVTSSLHALREIGNLAAHPTKYTVTGEIVPIEPGEAEWCLDVIEVLFHHYFVEPADLDKRKNALNEKLVAAGRKPLTS